MMRCTRYLSLALTIVLGGAIGSPANAQDSAAVERPGPDLITRSQIADLRANNAYDVVDALRHNWLIERMPVPQRAAQSGRLLQSDTAKKPAYDMNENLKSSPGQASGIQVYVDGVRVGTTSQLKDIHSAEIASIRHYNGSEAQARFGIGHGSGVIFVTTVGHKP